MPMEWVEYVCNICDHPNRKRRFTLDREAPSCDRCQSSVRMRAIAFLAVKCLSGAGGPLRTLERSKHVGIGLSDWIGYAGPLERTTRYRNTFYTREPKLDITRPPRALAGTADFLVASDVFEHVAPPISAAFKGAYELLKPGGAMLFSVPYALTGETIEHFPSLHEYSIQHTGTEQLLRNRTPQGQFETFRGLRFHGGEGATLEMRIFSLPSILALCAHAGLDEPDIMQDVPEYGIMWPDPWSHAMLIRKPRGGSRIP